MSDGDKKKLHMDPAQLAQALLIATVLLVLFGAWLLVAGVGQMRDSAQLSALQHARDDAVINIRRNLQAEQRKLSVKLASPAMKAALDSEDAAAAGRALASDWPDVERSEVWPADMQTRYAALPRGSFGSLAVSEAALVDGKPVARVVKSGSKHRLALAAPVTAARGPMLAYVELPLERLTLGLQNVALDDSSYLALRQGRTNILERGNATLGTAAEALSAKIGDTDMRIAAAMPDPGFAPFGMGANALLVAGSLLLLAGLGVWFSLRQRLLGAEVANDEEEEASSQTLSELQRSQPKPQRVVRDVGDTRQASQPVTIDRGIFRAYDIRGVVGQSLDAGVAELIGQAIGSLMHDKGLEDIVVGRDGRLSGLDLTQGLSSGLRKAGRNVIDIGMVPTPVVYFGCYHLRTGCGVA
ncbi:MAG: phosphomannomutase/phosphoglucomutase, partial [Thermomonas sp.]